MALNRLHISLLTNCFGFDGLAFCCDANNVLGHLADLIIISGTDKIDQIANLLLVNCLPFCCEHKQTVNGSPGALYIVRISGYFKFRITACDKDVKGLFDPFDIFIEGTEHTDDLFHSFCVDDSLHVFHPLRTDIQERCRK